MTDLSDRTEKRGSIAWMAGNPVAANLLMLILLVGGFIAFLNIKQEVFPDFELDVVNVSVAYPGASPEEVEQGIILAVEEAIRGVDGVEEVTSRAGEGFGSISAELMLGADRSKVYQDIQQEVDRITTFPGEAERAQVSLAARKREVVNLLLSGNLPEKTLRELGEQVRARLLQDPEITLVELSGVRALEIAVAISRDKLREYNLTLADVSRALRQSALELPGGGVKTEGGEILIRMKDRRDFGREFAAIPIVNPPDGTPVLLGDIAEIRDEFVETDRFATFNGELAIQIEVYRIGRQTPISVAKAALKAVEEIQQELPPGVTLSVRNDWSDIYRQRAQLLLKNGAIGLTLVIVLLGAFLEARLAFWVMMGIPISFLGGMLFLPAFDVSINMISMFAFLIALGIVVDDAIVVGENTYEYHERGMPFLKAASLGAQNVSMPVVFSVLTNIVTFLPLFLIPGTIGKIWRVIPAVVVTVFAISLIECLYVLPSHLGHVHGPLRDGLRARLHARQQKFSRWFSGMVRRRYGPLLEHVLQHRYLTLAGAIALLTLTIGYVQSGRMGIEAMPRVESDFAVVTAVLPYGVPVERTMAVRDRLEAAARAVVEKTGSDKEVITGIYSEIGRDYKGVGGSHVVEVRAYLPHPDRRPVGTRRFAELWRQETGRIQGLDALVFESDRGGPGSGASLTVEITHPDNNVLGRASADLAAALETFPIVSDIDPGFAAGKEQLNLSMRPEGLALGLTAESVAAQVRSAFFGAEALRQQRGRNEVKVMVRLPESERVSEHDIEALLIRTPAGTDVPLREVADVVRGRAYTVINRRNSARTVNVTANVNPPRETPRIQEALVASALPELRQKYPGLNYDFTGRQKDFTDSFASLKTGFILALLAIYGLLAIPFRSYTQPLIIMVSIPFGIVGAVIGHLIMGYSLSIMSLMGIVALSGVVVNDALVLIDYANRQRAEGMNVHDAITAAGVRRFRPIMLTTLTTFGGLAPMIFETSRQARFMIPMALSLGYGILFSTAITLVLVPSLYLIVEDVRHMSFHRKPQPKS